MKPCLFLTVCLLALAGGATAQNVQFEKTEHNFGLMQKNDAAQYAFTFQNVSANPVKLSSVKASCGCTTPDWTREEIAPGASGSITVSYNTAIAGAFYKSVTVMVEGETQPVMLYIKGEVANPDANAAANFPVHVGHTSFENVSVNAGTIDSDKSSLVTFRVRNSGPMPITFAREEKPAGFSVVYDKKTIVPGEVATVMVSIEGRWLAPGMFTETIRLTTNEADQNEKNLTVTGFLNKVWSEEELAKAPRIVFEQTEFTGGKVIVGEKLTFTYAFTNTGQQDLVIENVRASCGCTASAPKDKVLKPGQRSEIVATFDSAGRSGLQTKTVTVQSNDPQNANVVLRFTVEVESNPFHVGGVGPGASN